MFKRQFESFYLKNPTPIAWQPWYSSKLFTAKIYPPPRASSFRESFLPLIPLLSKNQIIGTYIGTFSNPPNSTRPKYNAYKATRLPFRDYYRRYYVRYNI